MRTYWDLSPAERLTLTDKDIEHYRSVELMRGGIAPVPELRLEEEPLAPDRVTERGYAIRYAGHYGRLRSDLILSASFDLDADDFSHLILGVAASDSSLRDDGPITLRRQPPAIRFESVDVAWEEDDEHAEERKAIRKRNDATKAEHERQDARVRAALSDMESNRQTLAQALGTLHYILTLLWRYIGLAGGDERLALRYLAETVTYELIDETLKTLGLSSMSSMARSSLRVTTEVVAALESCGYDLAPIGDLASPAKDAPAESGA